MVVVSEAYHLDLRDSSVLEDIGHLSYLGLDALPEEIFEGVDAGRREAAILFPEVPDFLRNCHLDSEVCHGQSVHVPFFILEGGRLLQIVNPEQKYVPDYHTSERAVKLDRPTPLSVCSKITVVLKVDI